MYFHTNRILAMIDEIVVHTDRPPTIEIDSDARAAYVRFSNNPVASTEPVEIDDVIITVDLDSTQQVVGVELVGVEEFNIVKLAERAHIRGIRADLLPLTRYVPAALQSA
jgi:uncharacterized protein YuzE